MDYNTVGRNLSFCTLDKEELLMHMLISEGYHRMNFDLAGWTVSLLPLNQKKKHVVKV